MGKLYLFPNDKVPYDTYLKTIEDMAKIGSGICCGETLKTGLEAITKIDDIEQRKRLVASSFQIDRDFSFPGALQCNTFKKLPLIMTVANMIGNHKEQVKGVTPSQFSFLSFFSFVVKPSEMEEHLDIFGDSLLLSIIESKMDILDDRVKALQIVEDKYYEFALDKASQEEVEKFKKESIMAIYASTKEEFLSFGKTEEQLMEDMIKMGL